MDPEAGAARRDGNASESWSLGLSLREKRRDCERAPALTRGTNMSSKRDFGESQPGPGFAVPPLGRLW